MSVSNFNIKSRLPFAHGQSFGKTGPYEILEGIFEFSVDPNNKHNESINDLELATTNDNGQVEFSSYFVILSPKDPNKGNGKIFFDILAIHKWYDLHLGRTTLQPLTQISM